MAAGPRDQKSSYFDSSSGEETPMIQDEERLSELMERYREESRQLEASWKQLKERVPEINLTPNELLLKQQQWFEEDIQAKVIETREHSDGLEQRCQELEDQLVRQLEQAELERLRAIEALQSSYEERETVLVQQLRELQLQLQLQRKSPSKLQQSPQSSTTENKGQTPGHVSINQLGVSGHTVNSEGHSEMPDDDKVHSTPTVHAQFPLTSHNGQTDTQP